MLKTFISIRFRTFHALQLLGLCALFFTTSCKESKNLNSIINPDNIDTPTPAGSSGDNGSGGIDSQANFIPTITSVTPNVGLPVGGQVITIVGTQFATGATVTVASTFCTSVLVTEKMINCVTPAHAAGFADVTVTNPNGHSVTSPAAFFYRPAPTITSLSPTVSVTGGGGILTVTGTGYGIDSKVYIDNVACPIVGALTTSLTCTIPAHPTGTVSVQVINGDGQYAILGTSFSYSSTPYVSAITPSAGRLAGGTTITLTASGFTAASTATVGSVACGSFTVVSPTTATCVTGANSAGLYDFTLTNAGLSSTLHNAYTYQPVPVISTISPNAGASGGGTAITITGSGYVSGATVSLGGTPCAGVTVVSVTQITCTSSAHSSGAVNVVVTNADGQSASIGGGYTYQAGPYVSSISPTSGSPSGGTALTITGSGFLSGATVSLAGASCFSPTVTATSISCTTTSHAAGAVTVTVTNPDAQTASLLNAFIYQSGPGITSVSPAAGPIAGGTSITINGSRFASGLTVTVGGASCGSVLVGSSAITCVTPANTAGAAGITVTNPDTQSATLAGGFTYNNAPTISSITASAGPVTGGTAVAITGSNFLSGVSVTIGGVTCTSPLNSSTQINCTTGSHTAGVVDVVATNYDNQSATLTNGFHYNPTPTFTSVSPTAGALAGGNVLTIVGTNFTAPTVTVGGSACTALSNTATQITCTTPAHSAGAVNIVISNNDAQTATGTNAFTYQPAPTVSSISPNAGPLNGGQTVTIMGSNFVTGATAAIAFQSCSPLTLVSATQINCVTPSHSAGAQTVSVTNADNQTGSTNGLYVYQPAPTFTSISPTGGNPNGGTAITITGTNFVSGAAVSLGGNVCSSPSVVSSSVITCTSAAHVAGLVSLIITNSDGQNVTASNSFTYEAPPTLASVSPSAGALAGGTVLTLTGTGFLSGAVVSVGIVSCPTLSLSSTHITCVTSANSAGLYSVTIANPDTQAATLSAAYTYNPAPTITSISPANGPVAGGTSVTIIGTNFLSGLGVTIGGVTCTSPLSSSTQINCSTGVHASGNVNVVVTNSDTQSATLTNGFSYNPTPTITSVSPVAGPLAGTNTLTIIGTNFSSSTVTVGGNTCTSPSVTSTQITCALAAHSAGTVNVVVTNGDGQSITSSNAYTYQPIPVVSNVSPAAGPLAGGQTVTVNGANFVAGFTVTVNGTVCNSYSLISATQISCVTPAHAAGAVNVVVTNADGQSGGGAGVYTYQVAPTFSSISPVGGSPSGGTNITITGAGFVTGATVTLGGNSCGSLSVVSSTQITCTTAAHAVATVNLIITNADSQSVTVNNAFTFEPAPTVSSVTPSAGALAGGTTLTVNGTGFITGAQVTIGGASCGTLSLTATRITCSTGANTSGLYSVIVTNPDTQSGALSFAYTYEAAPLITSISPASGALGGGSVVQINGSGFLPGAVATIGGATCTSPTITSTQITCNTPANTVGAKDVIVTNTDTQSYTLTSAYTYRAAPTVTSVSPIAGPLGGGTSITITGTNFLASPVVTVGGSSCTSVNLMSSTSISCATPSHLAGSVNVVVINTDGQSGTLNSGFSYQAGPTVSTITPAAGALGGSTTVTITGSNISATDTVSIGGSNCGSVSSSSSSQLTCVTSAHAAGLTNVVVTDAYSQSATLSNAFTYQPAPTISSITPGAGALAGSTSVTIVGTGFISGLSVQIGNGSCGSISSSATSITCTTPAGFAGAVNVVVMNTDNQSATLTNGYTYQPAPTISSVSPPAGSVNGGTAMTVYGTNFLAGATVSVGGITCTTPTITSTQITCNTGAHGAATVGVTVTNADSQSATLAASYIYQPAPTVASVTPNTGFVGGGYAVTVSGTGFLGSANVTFGGVACTNISIVNSTTITCNNPPMAAGAATVAVVNPDGQSGSLASAFTYSNSSFATMAQYVGTASPLGAFDATGTAIRFNNPQAVTITGGVMYFVEQSNCAVRAINMSTLVSTTFAGSMTACGFQDGAATSARFSSPAGIATDGTNLYIADTGNAIIRQIVISSGVVSTLAGVPGSAGNTDSPSKFNSPQMLTVLGGYLYLVDNNNHTIRQINISSGVTTTIAGNPGVAGSADGTGTAGTFYNPQGITNDGTYLYVADFNNAIIRRVTTGGTVLTIAGLAGNCGGSDGTGSAARICRPIGITTDGTNLYISDWNSHNLRQLTLSGYVMTTIAGTYNISGHLDGTSTVAKFTNPRQLFYSSGYVYIADYSNSVIRRYNTSTQFVSTFAGPPNTYGYQEGTLANAKFWVPRGLATMSGNLMIGERQNCLLRQVTSTTVSTLAGQVQNCSWEDGYGTNNTRLYRTDGMASDGTYIYLVDSAYHVVKRYDPVSQQMLSIAGAQGQTGTTDGTGINARFNSPTGIATNGTYLWVADQGNHTIRQITIGTWVVTTIAGTAGTGGSLDGTGTAAQFRNPYALTSDGTYLYIADYNNCMIRRLQLSNNQVTAFAGAAQGCSYSDGTTSAARFYNPIGITYDGVSNFYIADYNNHAVRKMTSAGVVSTLLGGPTLNYDSLPGAVASSSIRYPTNILWTNFGLFVANDYGLKQLH